MQLTREMPESRHRNEVVGLSRAKNEQFWQTVHWFNRIYYPSVNSFIFVFSAVISGLLFINRFENVDIWLYLVVQALHVLHTFVYLFFFLHSIYTVNLLFVAVMAIFAKKFSSIASRTVELNALDASSSKQINRKLSRLLFEHNKVHLEMLEMNALFSGFVAVNLVHLFL